MDLALEDWQANSGISIAVELIGTALALRQPTRAAEAAQFILERQQYARETEVEIAEQVLGHKQIAAIEASPDTSDVDIAAERAAVHVQKAHIRGDLRNAIAWTELARGYTLLGQPEPAKRAMDIAILVAPNNRYVLRSAARMYIHQGEPDKAHRIIARSPRTRSDPWLLSVEIAAADLAKTSPRLVRPARTLLDKQSWEPRHLTELAATLGTVEISAGHHREARRLFRTALIEPNENSLAQVEWASQQSVGIDAPTTIFDRPEAFEARARSRLDDGLWAEAALETWQWYFDQPFSSAPTISGSYSTSNGGDFKQSVRFADSGLRANPHNETLLNNAAFALLQLDRVDAAKQYLDRINRSALTGQSLVVNLATRGLLEYRQGRITEGRVLYLAAVGQGDKYPHMRAVAAILMAIEEFRQNSPEARQLGRMAAALSADIDDPAVRQWQGRLMEWFERVN